MNTDVTVRAATVEDAPEIANVHISSWREAYAGLLPAKYLDSLPLTFRRRAQFWKRLVMEGNNSTFVADSPVGIVGFCCMGKARDERFDSYAEVGAIYLLKAFKGRKLRFGMLRACFAEMTQAGFIAHTVG